MVDDVDEILSNDMYNIFFQCEGEGEGEEEAGGEAKAGAFSLKLFGEVDDTREKGVVETVLSPRTDEHQDREGEGGVDEQGDDEVEEGRGVVVDERKDSWDVIVVFDEQREDEEAQLEITSYSPEAGLVRKDGRLPEPSEDEVLIRVDATTISTRDCLERLRRNRDTNVKLKDDLWVPGHEIVGHVVRAGVNAEFLLDDRIAALLPYGGGCSQYVCIDANNVITLPEEAGSDEIVALLSTYMTAYQCLESVVGIAPEEEGDVDEKGDIESQKIPSIVGDAGQKTSPLLGKNVLIVGAGSPIGLALVDLARNAGATVYTLLGSRSRLSAIRNMGAHYWHSLSQKEVWEAEWRGKMDLIVDKVGDSDYHSSFYTVLKTRGRLVRMNITSCEKKYEPNRPLEGQGEQGFGLLNRYKERVIKDKSIDYDIFHSFYEDKESFTEDLIYLHDLLQIGKIRPRIFSRVGFDELEGEWEKVMTGETNGGGVVVVLPGRLVV
jgi:NADPH:quinone reductase-like Zn-dependent oxidoreductase